MDFYFQILDRENIKPRTAVDLACGTGSVTRLLAEKGLRVVGVDMSEDMLTVASDKCAELSNMPLFICQKLQNLRLARVWILPAALSTAWTIFLTLGIASRRFQGYIKH